MRYRNNTMCIEISSDDNGRTRYEYALEAAIEAGLDDHSSSIHGMEVRIARKGEIYEF